MEKENLVINDPESFKELWQRAICTTDFCPEVPAVDFSEKTVIAIFAGVKPTLSHHIVVEDVTENDQGLTVQIRFADSSGGCIGLPALSSPYHILAVTPKTGEAKVSFVESLQVIDCMANLP